ncbi:MAG TPA: DUF4178 domain-containing protein [Kofleriaceae bacterium]|nr:DUF4178 domain-containing protein [Kofleriaceae bacterium]
MFTALLIAILIVAGAATVVGGGLLWSSQRRRALERGAGEPRQLGGGDGQRLIERGVRDMRPGDVVQQGGRDWVVEGVLHYDEDGHRWIAGRMIDVQDTRWLVVGMDRVGSTSVRVMQHDDQVDVGGYPPEAIETDGKRYRLERRGTATIKLVGDPGAIPGAKDLAPESVLRCRWWRYQAAGPDCLLVEQWGGDFRVLRGTAIADDDVDLMPGS